MGVSIPTSYDVDVSGAFGAVGPVTIAGSMGAVGPVTVSGIPDTYYFNVEKLPQIDVKLEPITLEPVTVQPLTVNLAITEIPSVRTHVPANFSVGVSVLGMDVLCIRLCGEAQVITEPYVRNPCEYCGEVPEPPRQRGVRTSPLLNIRG